MIRHHDDTVDRVDDGDEEVDDGDEELGAVLHATPPNLYYGSGPPIRCIEWPRRRAIATDFNVSDYASAATVSYTAQCRTGHLFKGNIDSQQVFLTLPIVIVVDDQSVASSCTESVLQCV